MDWLQHFSILKRKKRTRTLLYILLDFALIFSPVFPTMCKRDECILSFMDWGVSETKNPTILRYFTMWSNYIFYFHCFVFVYLFINWVTPCAKNCPLKSGTWMIKSRSQISWRSIYFFFTLPGLIGFHQWTILSDYSCQAKHCSDDLNPVDLFWLRSRQLSKRPQLMVVGNCVAGSLCWE